MSITSPSTFTSTWALGSLNSIFTVPWAVGIKSTIPSSTNKAAAPKPATPSHFRDPPRAMPPTTDRMPWANGRLDAGGSRNAVPPYGRLGWD